GEERAGSCVGVRVSGGAVHAGGGVDGDVPAEGAGAAGPPGNLRGAAAGDFLGAAADEVDVRGIAGGAGGAGGAVFSDGAGGGHALPESRGCADVCGGRVVRGAHYSGGGVHAGTFGAGAELDSSGGLRGDGVGGDGSGSGDPLAGGAVCVAVGTAGGDRDLRGICDGGGVHGAVVGAAVYVAGSCGDFVCAGAGDCGDYVVHRAAGKVERAGVVGSGDGGGGDFDCGVAGAGGGAG